MNAPGHPEDLNHPNVQVEFLPPNTTSIIQPLDQGISYTFKMYYIRRSFQWILDTTESKSVGVMEVEAIFNEALYRNHIRILERTKNINVK